MDKYNITEDIARIYLDNIIYIQNKEYKSNKLNKLKDLKEELISNNLLTFDNLFTNYLKNKRIIFYNYNYFNKLQLDMINKLKETN